MKANKIQTVEQDSGLWFVYRGEQYLGAIWDGGSRIAGERNGGYQLLEDWNNIEPGELLGTAKHFQSAIHFFNSRN